jgi:hypothetical protein
VRISLGCQIADSIPCFRLIFLQMSYALPCIS